MLRVLFGSSLASITLSCVLPADVQAASITVCDEQELRNAITQGGTIDFACDGTIVFTREMVVSRDTILDASGRTVVLSGSGSNRLFRVEPGIRFTLKNLVLRDGLDRGTNGAPNNGGVPGLGGAILNQGGALTVIGCRILNNSAIGGTGGEGSSLTGGPGQGGAASGGAIYTLNGGVFLADTVFSFNTAQSGAGGSSTGIGVPGGPGGVTSGGALWCDGGRLAIQGCRFEDNRCLSGGSGSGYFVLRDSEILGAGIFATNAELNVSRTEFRGNTCTATWGALAAGGGIFHASHLLTAIDCVFRSNRVTGGPGIAFRNYIDAGDAYGGAVVLLSGNDSIANCTFVDNRSTGGDQATIPTRTRGGLGKGGGVYSKGTLTLINSTFVGNITRAPDTAYGLSGLGGGLWSGAPALLTHVTMVSNSAEAGYSSQTNAFRGGAIYAEVRAQLRNTLLAHSLSGSNAAGLFQDENGNLSSDPTPAFNAPLSRNNIDPKVDALGYYGGPTPTVTLQSASPAIDSADPANCAEGDQRGAPRPYGAGCDIGAVEMWPSNSVFGRITGYRKGDLSIRAAGLSTSVWPSGVYALIGLPPGTWMVSPASSEAVFAPAETAVTVGPSAFGVNFQSYQSNALSIVRDGNVLKLLFAGEAGTTYHVETSSNVPVWQPYLTNTMASSIFEFTDTNRFAPGLRAFRVLRP